MNEDKSGREENGEDERTTGGGREEDMRWTRGGR